MFIEPNWDVFKCNFSENPQKYFEWMCYLLFCKEFNRERGITTYENQTALETSPIPIGNDIIGFQAKFYEVKLSARKKELKEAIDKAHERYPELTKILFYINKNWSEGKTDGKTQEQIEVENYASQRRIEIDWRQDYYFRSPEVAEKYASIIQKFFSKTTSLYYENIKQKEPEKTIVDEKDKYTTLLCIEGEYKETKTIKDKFSLFNFIDRLLKEKELTDFKNIYVKGRGGISKSTEMKFAYNKLISKLSSTDSCCIYNFLPTPYFFELKYYQKNCFGNITSEIPLLFLDGLDEISGSTVMMLVKELYSLRSSNSNCRFILAGRAASFIKDINDLFEHINTNIDPYSDEEVLQLTEKFEGTPLGSLVQIPFYRDFVTKEKIPTTYKEFFSKSISEKLFDDLQRLNIGKNIPSMRSTLKIEQEKINLEKLENKISNMVYKLFKSDVSIFTHQDVQKYLVEDDKLEKKTEDEGLENEIDEESFFINSSLVDCNKSDETFSFCSNVYFDYFLAKFYSKQDFALIRQDLFLSKCMLFGIYKVNRQHVNILINLLNLISAETKLYNKVSKKLDCEIPEYILLTDYGCLPIKKRFYSYRKILDKYNYEKRLISFCHFLNTDDILEKINSLPDSMHNLLPKEFYAQAIKNHCDTIQNFLDKPNLNKIIPFENAIILLGVRNSNWNNEQQKTLKKVADQLLEFFLNNGFAKKMRYGEDDVLRWYENYKWSDNWEKNQWISFVKELTSVENTDFYNFKDEKEYCFKLKLFIHFHNNAFIQKLFVPLAKKILTSTSLTAIDSFVPNIETKTVDFNYDIILFTDIFKKSDVSVSDILKILQIYPLVYGAIPIEAHELYREVLNAFERIIPDIKEENISEFYGALVNYIETGSGTYLYNFNKYIKLLNDDQKEKVFHLLFADLTEKVEWQNSWMLPRIIVVPLLNMYDKQRAISLFEKLRNVDVVYKKFITDLYYSKDEKNPLYETAVNEYSEVFAEQVKIDKEREEKLNAFYKSRDDVLKQEIDVITNKDNSLINEVNRIFEYINKYPDFSENKDISGKLLDLRISHIESKLKHDYKKEYKYEIISPFAIDFLIHSNEDDPESNHENIIKIINDWFSNEKYFWRYFFWTYISYHKKEEVDEFINKYPPLTERIKESIQQEITQFLVENDIFMYDGGKNRFWVAPFVYYLTRFYDNKLPDWFDKDKILNFIAYPAWHLSTHIGYDIHVNFEFKWKDWSSVFEWIEEVAGIDKDVIVKKALSLFPKLKNEESKAQIISFFVKNVNSESLHQQILDVIIKNTISEIQKDYNNYDLVNGVLSSFWSGATENYVERLYSYINFEKYNLEGKNSCRTAVLEYFCNVATDEQKAKVIERLKNKTDMPNIQIYLAKLGNEEAIIKIIDAFLKGQNLNRSWDAQSKMFGKSKKSFKLLRKYCKLHSYSLEKENCGRDYLYTYAKRGIMQTATRWNFWYVKYCLNKEIKRLKEKGLYYESQQYFLNEIEQKVFSPKQGDDK